MSDAPDTAHSALVTDHHFVPPEDMPWALCTVPVERNGGWVKCNMSRAAHRHDEIEDTDPGRPPSMRFEEVTPPPEMPSRSEIMREQGHKDDDLKTPFFYLPWDALEDVAFVMQFGAFKYAPGNYRKGMKSSRLFSACVRHIVDWWRGKEVDEETGRPVLAHAICCLLMLLETEKINKAMDDRYA